MQSLEQDGRVQKLVPSATAIDWGRGNAVWETSLALLWSLGPRKKESSGWLGYSIRWSSRKRYPLNHGSYAGTLLEGVWKFALP